MDSLRGIAILGILLMNIPGFGLPHSAIFDYSLNQQSKLNYFLWYVFGPGVFEGIGFGYFGRLQIYQLYYVVVVVWIIEIVWSHLWLRQCRFGGMVVAEFNVLEKAADEKRKDCEMSATPQTVLE